MALNRVIHILLQGADISDRSLEGNLSILELWQSLLEDLVHHINFGIVAYHSFWQLPEALSLASHISNEVLQEVLSPLGCALQLSCLLKVVLHRDGEVKASLRLSDPLVVLALVVEVAGLLNGLDHFLDVQLSGTSRHLVLSGQVNDVGFLRVALVYKVHLLNEELPHFNQFDSLELDDGVLSATHGWLDVLNLPLYVERVLDNLLKVDDLLLQDIPSVILRLSDYLYVANLVVCHGIVQFLTLLVDFLHLVIDRDSTIEQRRDDLIRVEGVVLVLLRLESDLVSSEELLDIIHSLLELLDLNSSLVVLSIDKRLVLLDLAHLGVELCHAQIDSLSTLLKVLKLGLNLLESSLRPLLGLLPDQDLCLVQERLNIIDLRGEPWHIHRLELLH